MRPFPPLDRTVRCRSARTALAFVCGYETAAIVSGCRMPPLSWLAWRSTPLAALVVAAVAIHLFTVPPNQRKAPQ